MVLQKGPHSASGWGYIPECDPITVTFNGKTITATLVAEASGGCRWKATLPPTTGTFYRQLVYGLTQKLGVVLLCTHTHTHIHTHTPTNTQILAHTL